MESTLLRAPTAMTFTISDLMEKVSEGRVRVPKFQRNYRWNATDVIRLFDSIYKGYPIGSLLLWTNPAEADTLKFGPLEIQAESTTEALWVVDGQQRITSLAAVLLGVGDIDDPQFSIFFDLVNRRFVPLRTPTPSTWLPMNRVNDTRALLRWLTEFQQSGATDELVSLAEELATRIRDYKVPAYLVDTDDIDTLRSIFDRMNTFGKPLTSSEVFHALHGGRTSHEPQDLKSLDEHIAELGFGDMPGNTLLRSVLAIRSPDVYRDFRNEFAEGEDPADAFTLAEESITRTIAFLKNEAEVPHIRVLPYRYVIPVLTRFFYLHPEPTDRSLLLLRRWLWRDALKGGGKSTSVSTLRDSVRAVTSDENRSVQELIAMVDGKDASIASLPTRLNEARARAYVAMMASWHPRSLVDGSRLLLSRLFDESGTPIPVLVKDPDWTGSLADRIIQGPTSSPPVDLLTDSPLRRRDPVTFDEILESHTVTPQALDRLLSGNPRGFLMQRLIDMQDRLRQTGMRLAEWNANDRPPITSLVKAEDDDGSGDNDDRK